MGERGLTCPVASQLPAPPIAAPDTAIPCLGNVGGVAVEAPERANVGVEGVGLEVADGLEVGLEGVEGLADQVPDALRRLAGRVDVELGEVPARK